MHDLTQKPLRIPPAFQEYAEKHDIYSLYQTLLKQLIIQRPSKPLDTMIQFLQQEQKEPTTSTGDDRNTNNSSSLKIVIVGPPLCGKSRLARLLAAQLGLEYMSPWMIAHEAMEAGSALGKQAKSYLYTKQNIPDSLLLGLLVEKINKSNAAENHVKGSGWVFDGFPRNRDQALACQMAGIIPTHVLVLEGEKEEFMARLDGMRINPETGETFHVEFDPPSGDQEGDAELVGSDHSLMRIEEKFAQYQRSFPGFELCYKNRIFKINGQQSKDDVLKDVLHLVQFKEKQIAPHPTRALIFGPPGSGKTTIAERLEDKYGIVVVDVGRLMDQKAQEFSDIGDAIRKCCNGGEKKNIPPALILEVVKARVQESDCVAKGFILNGVSTPELLDCFVASGEESTNARQQLALNRVIVFEQPEELSCTRKCLRWTDPHTGNQYHSQENPPPNEEIAARLVQHKDDTEKRVQAQLKCYNAYKGKVSDAFGDISQFFDSSKPIYMIFQTVESRLIRPFPRKFD
eukprot:Nk52_evm30s485 gene=Nk52_evmTU30s485